MELAVLVLALIGIFAAKAAAYLGEGISLLEKSASFSWVSMSDDDVKRYADTVAADARAANERNERIPVSRRVLSA